MDWLTIAYATTSIDWVSWSAAGLSLSGAYRIARKDHRGFYLMMGSNFCWFYWAVAQAPAVPALATIDSIYFCINIYGLHSWTKKSKKPSFTTR